MLKKLIYFIFALAMISAPLSVFADQKSAYPEEVTRLLPRAEKTAACENRKGVIGYLNDRENWVVRVFTRDKKPLEIWVNYNRRLFWEYYPDKIYYFVDDKGWLSADNISGQTAKKLDRRIKFSSEEIEYLKNCLNGQK